MNLKSILEEFYLYQDEAFQNQKYRNQSAARSLADGGRNLKFKVIMFVPNAENAVVDARKLVDYCLNPNHEIGKHKALVFEKLLDLTVDDAKELKNSLLFAVRNNEARAGRFDKFGQRYTVDFEMLRGSKRATVRSGWIIETNTSFPRLTTCFVL